eukprot:TRINITY_DN75039_c0_g1_i1.p1 TRINITY_DN75039_c0_g1~~TRINITY_DN75039_c0_g1_i1.p1  ORF type:complete len:284 (+),score=51.56 TRINITY_DN75039_c0_g1_i1:152-1003(+)
MALGDLAVNVLAGGLAGAVETSITYPLDLAKTRQQLSTSSSSTVPRLLREVYSDGGVQALYRGLSAPLVSEVPRRALKFAANGVYKDELGMRFPGRSWLGDVAVATAAGASAGASETVLHTPFEVVKIRMQAAAGTQSASAIAKDIVKHNGVRGLWVGLEAYALRQAVWNGGFFGFIGLGKATMPKQPEGAKKMASDFLLGLTAGCTATCINNPLDVAKSRLQYSGIDPQRQSRWSLGVTADIAKSEGLRGICRGLPARLYRSAPGHGLLYVGFEFFSQLLRG